MSVKKSFKNTCWFNNIG